MNNRVAKKINSYIMKLYGLFSYIKFKGRIIAAPMAFRRSPSSRITVGKDATIRCEGEGEVSFFQNTNIQVSDGATLSIGGHSYVNHDSTIICTNRVSFGKNCIVAWEVQIMDSDFHRINNHSINGDIIIGDNVWIGSRVTILKGTRIGSGSVVAAGSVVKGKFPEKCLLAGVPAKVVRENIVWQR